MRLYDAGQNVAKGIWRNHAAVLDCAVQDDQTGFSGGLDRAVRMCVGRCRACAFCGSVTPRTLPGRLGALLFRPDPNSFLFI